MTRLLGFRRPTVAPVPHAPSPQAAALFVHLFPSPAPSPAPIAHEILAPSSLAHGYLAPAPTDFSQSPIATISRWMPVYRWIPIVGALVAFAWSLTIGANDVASSFATSVGSKALSMVMAVVLAAVMEFIGAAFVGDRTIDTFQSTVMKEVPADRTLLMWGLFIAILVATIYLALATRWEMPVSSTLAILGAIIGVSIAGNGFTSIYWNKTSTRLHLGGVLGIFLSWIIAPLIAGLSSFALFGFTKLALLRATNAEKWTLGAIPLYYGMTTFVLILFIIYRGTPGLTSLKNMYVGKAFLIAGVSGIVAGLLALVVFFLLYLKRKRSSNKIDSMPTLESSFKGPEDSEGKEMQQREEDLERTADDLLKQFADRHTLETVYEAEEEETSLSPQGAVDCAPSCTPRVTFQQILSQTSNRSSFKRMRSRKQLTRGQKVEQLLMNLYMSTINHKIDFDRETEARHRHAEKFDSNTERMFSFLQILTACIAAFSHGSNEVVGDLNAYAAIKQLYYHHNDLNGNAQIPIWILLLGGVGVSLGFAIWGWKLVRCIGGGITYMSPSRGYCAQICAVATGLLATGAHLPISTTHIVIGSILGVGLADNAKNVNWKLLLIFVAAWVGSLVLSSSTAAGIYSFTVYSPSYSGG